MSTQEQTYVTSYTTDVDPRTLPDYDPDNYNYVPQAARQSSKPASSYTSDGPRQRKKYVTTTVTTVTTTTIVLPKMQEAFVLPSVTKHDMNRQIGNGSHPQRSLIDAPSYAVPPLRPNGQAPRALPMPPPSAHGGSAPYQRESPNHGGLRGSPNAQPPRPPQPSQGSYPPSSQRRTSTSDSHREDSLRHLFPPGTAVPQQHLPEGPGQNPYHSLPLRIDARGPSSTPSSALRGVPASAPAGQPGAYSPPHAGPHQGASPLSSHGARSPHPSEINRHARAVTSYPPPHLQAQQVATRGAPTQPSSHPHHSENGDATTGDPWSASHEVALKPDGSVAKPWVYNQNNSKAVTTTATYDRAPTLEELGITSYFADQAPAHRSAPYVTSNPSSGRPQPWVVNETREELEGGNAYRYQ